MKIFSWILAVVGTVSVILVSILSVVFWYNFTNNCEDYLKLSGDAPTVERADKFLGQAISYIEKKSLTTGNSAYIFSTPQNDLSIWYDQLKGAKETTHDLLEKAKNDPTSVTQLERDNALMKIREVVLDNSSSGTSVTLPTNITWFPFQWGMLIWWWASILIATGGWFLVFKSSDYY